MPKVNYSKYAAVESVRWDDTYMTGNVHGLTFLGFDGLKVENARSGIILEGLTVGTTGSAHLNLTLSDGIEYLHLTIFDKTKTKVTKAAIYYKIDTWGAGITLAKVTKTWIVDKLVACANASHPDDTAIKQDLQRILTALFAGCKDA